MKKLSLLMIVLFFTSGLFALDSLLVEGKVMLDGIGKSNVDISGIKTDDNGGFSFKVPAGVDSLLIPVYQKFLFEPPTYQISSNDTVVDSLFFTAVRQIKKTIIVSGQSNAEHVGLPKYFVECDSVDNEIPYYLAYSSGDFGLSTLGLLTKFGKTISWCNEYNHGFGLEILLARTLYENYTDSLAVIKLPYSGTSLYYDWTPTGPTWVWFNEKYNRAVSLLRAKGYEPEYIGVFWFQGESDELSEAAPVYGEKLYEMVDRMRALLPNSSTVDELPFICVKISWNPSSPYETTIQEAQMAISENRTNTACIEIDECLGMRYGSSNMHFSGAALNRIGYKLARTYLEMVGEPLDSGIVITVDLDEAVDTTVILTVEGDTSFTHIMDDVVFDFPAKFGDSLVLSLNLNSEVYNYSPAQRIIDFAYPQEALKDPTSTFNVNKVVGIQDYPEKMDFITLNAYPNPFNPSTTIEFALKEMAELELKIFDLQGREVCTLIQTTLEQGSYNVIWNAEDRPSGMYIARIQAGNVLKTQKLLLMK